MDPDPAARRSPAGSLGRRLLTVPAVVGTTLALVATLPVWLPILAVLDLIRRRRFASLRTGLFIQLLLLHETLGILGAFWLWIRHLASDDEAEFLERNFRLVCWWVDTNMASVRRIFDVRFEIETPPDFARGPLIVLMRHASLADALLGGTLFSSPHGIRLRYVLKQELRWGPCLDIVGHRLPNVFVSRNGANRAAEIAAVSGLARSLGNHDGVLIYPEGTRFTPERRRRILASLAERGERELVARAEKLQHTLPPRPGGTLALLEAAPTVDVALVGHVGFEAATGFADLWSGRLIGTRVRVRGWRFAATEIPSDRGAWLFDQWQILDDWIAKQPDPHA